LKSQDILAFMKAKQAVRRYGAITLSAKNPESIASLLDELERRFWPQDSG
jgi:GTP-binding protein HflX